MHSLYYLYSTQAGTLSWIFRCSYQVIKITRQELVWCHWKLYLNTNILDLWCPPGVDLGAFIIRPLYGPAWTNH